MTEKKRRLPRYQRSSHPPSLRLTAHDNRNLEAIHAYDGILGFSQIQPMFFTGKSQTEKRLLLLYQNRYLNRPEKEQCARIRDGLLT